ncbi:hypothetical protein [Halorhabdus sp. CUG00001]|uniref:hypothetical protein n=1 Tax=Halorhabdus sp. CUG00001 TaxID=2600297 RepID=UPI00131DF24C|nr:hypothetical protein [Halorhabdus sp. CUG00001]
MGVLFAGEVQWLVGSLSSNGVVLISFGLDALVEWINTQIFNAVFTLIGYLLNGSMQTLLHLNPTALKQFQDMWELSVGIYFALLTVFALAHLGMFQFFPDGKKSDPYRFAGRALAATLSLFIINPPGWGPTLWGQGLFAAAFQVSNATIDMFLESTTFTISASPNTGGVGSFVLLLFGLVMGLIVTIGQLLMFVVLIARKVIVYLTYGLYPLLIVFWIGELGPLKYAKAVSEKLFKATGMLIPGGILIAGVFAVGMEFATGTLAMLAGGSVGSGGVDGAFASGNSVHPLLAAAMPLMAVTAMNLVAITYVVKWLSGAMGGAASKMTGKAKSAMKGGASKASRAVSGGASGGMVGGMSGGLMGGGDQTAVNNRFGGGSPAPAGAAGGGGGRDERDSKTVTDTAPDLEQSSLNQYGEGRLAEGQREEYTEPGREEYEEPDADSGERSGDVEGRLDRLESEVDAGSEEDPAASYTPGELTIDEAKSMTDNEEMAKTMVAMDEKMASLSEPDESTAMGQEAAKGAVAGAAGAGAGQTVGAVLGGIGGSIAGPAGTVAGAALGGAIGGAAGGIGGHAASRMVGEGSVRGGLERVSDATSGITNKTKQTFSDALPGGSGEGESGSEESANVGDTDGKDAIRND